MVSKDTPAYITKNDLVKACSSGVICAVVHVSVRMGVTYIYVYT